MGLKYKSTVNYDISPYLRKHWKPHTEQQESLNQPTNQPTNQQTNKQTSKQKKTNTFFYILYFIYGMDSRPLSKCRDRYQVR